MKGILRILGRDRERERPFPIGPQPNLQNRQTRLEDFNMKSFNNNSAVDVMEKLDVDHIIFKRGESYVEEE